MKAAVTELFVPRFVARDKNGEIFLYSHRPLLGDGEWVVADGQAYDEDTAHDLFGHAFGVSIDDDLNIDWKDTLTCIDPQATGVEFFDQLESLRDKVRQGKEAAKELRRVEKALALIQGARAEYEDSLRKYGVQMVFKQEGV